MTDIPFMGELKLMSFNFAPQGWAQCNGQLLPINQNQAIFSLLGTQYGGDGRVNFALPDLRGRTPNHRGNGFSQGQAGGEQSHTLAEAEMPAHNHLVMATNSTGDTGDPAVLGKVSLTYGPPNSLTTIEPTTITSVGGGQPHENRAPYLVLNWCIALQGIFPSRN
jgi:microcystin-dependent protein